eukprot:7454050-Pyramimonas_sp.AAC.1
MSDRQGAIVALIRGVFVVLRSQEWCSGTIQDRQDATETVIRGVEVAGTVFWHSSGFLSGCFPTGHFLSVAFLAQVARTSPTVYVSHLTIMPPFPFPTACDGWREHTGSRNTSSRSA